MIVTPETFLDILRLDGLAWETRAIASKYMVWFELSPFEDAIDICEP